LEEGKPSRLLIKVFETDMTGVEGTIVERGSGRAGTARGTEASCAEAEVDGTFVALGGDIAGWGIGWRIRNEFEMRAWEVGESLAIRVTISLTEGGVTVCTS
jgi:hypothetical protein